MKSAFTILAALLLVGAAGLAHAQVTSTGSVGGTVLDADGAPLPGVTATITSASLIGQQVVFTGTDGTYRATLLPPGNYRLVFELQGFSTVVYENVNVGVRRTSTIGVSMRLASVEETITVTARSPIVDIKSTKGGSEYSDALRNTLPEIRGVGRDLMNLSPDASPGGTGDTGSTPSFFGSPTGSNAFQVDGVSVTDPGGGGQFPFYSPDWFEVVEMVTSGAGAEYGKAQGGVFNVVTKSGGNNFHGEGNFFYQGGCSRSSPGEGCFFIGDNTQNVTNPLTGGPSVLSSFSPPVLDYRYDATANLGGPLKKDEIWFFAGYQAFYDSFQRAGAEYVSPQNSDRFLGKFTWQANQNTRLIGSVMADTYTLDGRPARPNTDISATAHEPSMNITPNITWNSVLSPDAFLELKYSGFYGFFDLIPISEGPASFDLGTGRFTDAYWAHYTFDRARTNFQGNVSYFAEDFAGSHSFKFGLEYENLKTDDQARYGLNGAGEGIIYYPYFGDPYLAYQNDPDFTRNTSNINVLTAFVQDDWTIADRVTLNLGARFDSWKIGFVDVTRPDEPTFNDFAPRAGINFDVFGDGRTALHGFWGRFYEEAHGSSFDNFDPQRSDFVGLFWDGAQFTEFFRTNALTGLGIDPDLQNTYSDQITVGIDHQLFEDVAVGVKWVHKDDKDLYGGKDVGSTFVPVSVTDLNGNSLTLFNADIFDRFRLMVNNPNGNLERTYNGVQFLVNKRLADNWALIASLMVQKSEANFFTSSSQSGNGGSVSAFDTPNVFVGAPGELPNSRRYVFKLQGSYLLPDPIRTLIGFQFDAMSSGAFTHTQRFSGFNQGRVTVPIEQMGSTSLDSLKNLNVRAEKKFQLPNALGDLGLLMDVFNVTNEDTVTNIQLREPFFGDPRSIPNPRIFRIALRWLF